MMAAASFPELAAAKAAFALGDVWFRCGVCGKKHRAGAGAWDNCAWYLVEAWGLSWWKGSVEVKPEAALSRAFWPSLTEAIVLAPFPWKVGEEYPWQWPDASGITWPVLLSLDADAAEKTIRLLWDGWWVKVTKAVRETAVDLRRECGGYLPRVDPRGDMVLTEHLRAILANRPEDPRHVKDLVVGEHTVAYRAGESPASWLVVRFFAGGCRVRVKYTRSAVERGVGREPGWLLQVAEEAVAGKELDGSDWGNP